MRLQLIFVYECRKMVKCHAFYLLKLQWLHRRQIVLNWEDQHHRILLFFETVITKQKVSFAQVGAKRTINKL